jgi:hypothetical protein
MAGGCCGWVSKGGGEVGQLYDGCFPRLESRGISACTFLTSTPRMWNPLGVTGTPIHEFKPAGFFLEN